MKAKRPSRLAIIDHLTGLYNRRHFDKRLKKIISESKKKKGKFSLLMIDIDKFKDVNDKYGHLAGDKVLNDLARVLRKSVRKPDICFRYGGDEIAVILPNTKKEAAERIEERLKSKIEKHKFSTEGGITVRLKLSIGLAVFPDDGLEPKALIKKADELLYKVKRQKSPKRKIAEPFILETKLIPPVLKESTISRRRLLSLLKKNLNRKLILITANAGYGKTTFLLQFLKEEKLPHVFYTLDDSDSELTTFISHLAFGLEKGQKGLCTRTRNLITQIQNPAKNYEMVIGTLINELLQKRKEELFIILDDYHNIEQNSILHNAMNYFIEHLPENIRLIISSRAVPQLTSIPRWHSKQDMFEMTREQLRFTDDEIKSLLREIYKRRLRKVETEQLTAQTEGWITGIQLILQTAGRDGKTIKQTLNGYLASNKQLFDYFANEVFRQEQAKMQDFLKKTSIPEVITPEICNKVFEIKNPAKLLENLERKNLFLSEIGKAQYKYHGLFRDFLQTQITDEAYKKSLHQKIAHYYQQKGQVEQTIQHYLRAKSYSNAAKVIEQIAEEFCDQGKFQILKEWIKSLPEDIKREHPRIMTNYSRILLFEGKSSEAEELAKTVLKRLKRLGDKRGCAYIYYILATHAWLRGDYRISAKLAKSALHGFKGRLLLRARLLNRLGVVEGHIGNTRLSICYFKEAIHCAKRCRNVPLLSAILLNAGVMYGVSGQFAKARQFFQESLRVTDHTPNPSEPYIYNALGQSEMYCGDGERADYYFKRGIEASQLWGDKRVESFLLISQCEQYLIQEKFNEAKKLLKKASAMLNVYGNLVKYYEAQLLLADLFIRAKSYSKAARIIDNLHRKPLLKKNIELYGFFLLEKGKLLLSHNQKKKSKQLYSQALRIFRHQRNTLREITAEILLAEVSFMLKEKNAIRIHLHRALKAAQSSGFWGAFLTEKNRVKSLLEYALKNRIKAEAASHLLTMMGVLPENGQAKVVAWLFGEFEVEVNGISITRLFKRKTTKAIFAYLLLHPNKSSTWEQIASLIWPESPSKSAHRMFLIALWEIRKLSPILKDFIVCKDTKYKINPNILYSSDVQSFENLNRDAKSIKGENQRIKYVEEAVTLYQAPLLNNFYYSWVEDLRDVYEGEYCNILQSLAQCYYQEGNLEKSNSFCKKYLAVDNLSEDIHRLVMQNYIGLGKKSMVIKQYKKLKKILSEELQVEPSSVTTNLYNSIF